MTVADVLPAELLEAARERFAANWQVSLAGQRFVVRPQSPLPSGQVQRIVPEPRQLLNAMASTFATRGVPAAGLLPIRWGRDTDLTISAVQALDPWLKDGINRVWREGFLPQPVVRFTGERDAQGHLKEGYLTSFCNVSCVQRIASVADHVRLLDIWIEALSAIGIHARRLTIQGDLVCWQRGPVSGITWFITCDSAVFADAVLLWHNDNPLSMATDIGSGLERIRWILSRANWAETTFGPAARRFDTELLDAVRTATLLVMAGIRPSASGTGSALRRVLRSIPSDMAAAGLGRLVRAQRAYWTAIGMTGPDWPQLATLVEDEVLAMTATRPTYARNVCP
ncbi:hypothetical protein [Kutzneria sp. NPDC051319]|uniref:hypothetical protein n=1 Tax=Kutzneria sp. NPDC051319 TaxID=3155047 RepID=UPI003419C9C6